MLYYVFFTFSSGPSPNPQRSSFIREKSTESTRLWLECFRHEGNIASQRLIMAWWHQSTCFALPGSWLSPCPQRWILTFWPRTAIRVGHLSIIYLAIGQNQSWDKLKPESFWPISVTIPFASPSIPASPRIYLQSYPGSYNWKPVPHIPAAANVQSPHPLEDPSCSWLAICSPRKCCILPVELYDSTLVFVSEPSSKAAAGSLCMRAFSYQGDNGTYLTHPLLTERLETTSQDTSVRALLCYIPSRLPQQV